MEFFKTLTTPTPPILPRIPHRPLRSFISLSSVPSRRAKLADSLQSETLQTLEWPSVCNQLSAFTSTTMGLTAARTSRIPLGKTSDESRKLLAQTAAAVAVARQLDFSGILDVTEILDSAVGGQLLTVREICAVRKTLESSRTLFEQLKEVSLKCSDFQRNYDSSREIISARIMPGILEELCCINRQSLQHFLFPSSQDCIADCSFLTELEEKIGFCIDCKYEMILDRASAELEIIRSERRENMENLESLLKQVSVKIFQAGGIDRPLVTRRRSRMCVGVRATRRSLLPNGVVLNASSSGATYFMEPKEAVELNNMEVKLSNAEKIEEQVILSFLTSEIAKSVTEIKCLLDRVLELDLAFARAAHARWMNGVCPIINSDDSEGSKLHVTDTLSIDIDGIQHPLLLETSLRRLSDLAVSEACSSVSWPKGSSRMDSNVLLSFPVPIDIKVKCGTRVVVISGPNTGGKTASMKTLGLASVMLKAGMYIPARNQPTLPWFNLILADIGDHQSLEQNLSTFSGHLSRICKILEVASEESLILMDEIGSGTDPSEGMALSTSILQYLKDRAYLAVVTTHYADLSHLKENDTRFENAAMEFSLETLQPTYRVLWGSTGESNALSIAKSLGFDENIVKGAQKWVGRLMPEKAEKRRGLLYESLMEERNMLEEQANKAESLYSDTMTIYHEIRDSAVDLDWREAALMAKETQQIQKEIKAVKSQIETVAEEFENQLRTASADQLNSLLKESESTITSIVEGNHPIGDLSIREANRRSYTPRLGDQVLVKGLGNKLATIVDTLGTDDDVLVQYGKIRVWVSPSSIRALPSTDTSTSTGPSPRVKRQGQKIKSLRNLSELSNTVETREPVVQTSQNTVDLRGMRAEEATRKLKLAIDSRGPNSVLFIIHGMGTGVVKECALKLLRSHPGVTKFEQESPMNYGCTIAYIK